MKLPLEIVVGSNYVKYEKLNELINRTYSGSTATVLNIFVDLYSIFKPLFSRSETGGKIEYEMSSDVELSADVINLCAHYRSFFYKQGVQTNFYLIYSTNTPERNGLFCPGYNKEFMNSYLMNEPIRKMLKRNLKALEVLCPYLYGIYFINIGNEEISGYIEYLMNTQHFNNKEIFPDTENMIITKDVLPLQLVSSGCSILRPKKYKGSDNSFMINHDNFWFTFISQMRNSASNSAVFKQLDIRYFANILAMTRVPERCMSSLKSLPVAYDALSRSMSMGYTMDDYSQQTINKILEILGVHMNYTTLELRWKAISSKFIAEHIIPTDPTIANQYFQDINDPNGVKDVCARYYQNSPIDLDRL